MNRRNFLTAGALGALGITMPDILRAEESAKGPAVKAKSVIQIYLPGGMAHQESWDPQVGAPIEYRGPLGSTPTKIPGVHFSSNMKRTAAVGRITCSRDTNQVRL